MNSLYYLYCLRQIKNNTIQNINVTQHQSIYIIDSQLNIKFVYFNIYGVTLTSFYIYYILLKFS